MFEEKLEVLLDSIRNEQNVNVVDVISSSKLRLITEEYQKRLSQENGIICNILKVRQKRRNAAFLSAISEFLQDCEKNSVRPVFFKGLFLAEDLYNQPETRISNDIDVIISLDEFFRCNEILENLGYVHEFYSEENDTFEYYLEEIKQRHLGYIKTVDDITVHIEVHATVVNPASIFLDITDEFIGNSVQAKYDDLTPRVLSTEYNLIALSMHFFKHLPLTYFQNMLFGRAIDVNLENVHDIVLLVTKYKKDIDWSKVIEIAKRMWVVKYFLMVAVFANSIYGDIFDNEVLNLLSENKFFSKLSTKDSERDGLGKLLWLFDIYVDYCVSLTPEQFLMGKLAEDFRMTDIGIGNNSLFYKIGRSNVEQIGRKFIFSLKTNKDEMITADFKLKVSVEGIEIKYSVDNKSCCYYSDEEGDCYKKDGIEIIIVKDKHIVHRMFTISLIDNRYEMVVYSNNTEKISHLENNEVKYDLKVLENRFDVCMNVPWSFLDVSCRDDRRFLFNVAGLISDPKTGTQDRACNLFEADKTIWDFRNINGIISQD